MQRNVDRLQMLGDSARHVVTESGTAAGVACGRLREEWATGRTIRFDKPGEGDLCGVDRRHVDRRVWTKRRSLHRGRAGRRVRHLLRAVRFPAGRVGIRAARRRGCRGSQGWCHLTYDFERKGCAETATRPSWLVSAAE